MIVESGVADVTANLSNEFVAQAREQLQSSVVLIRHCLGQLDEPQVWWRPREGMNAIGNLLLHLTGNLTQRFDSEIGGEPDRRDRTAEFTQRGTIPKEELLRRFDEAAARADEVLAGLAPERLLETRRSQRLDGSIEKTILGLVFQTLTHLNGHAQEILQMTRAQLGDAYTFRQPAGVPPCSSWTVYSRNLL
jgi:hypothetical protein